MPNLSKLGAPLGRAFGSAIEHIGTAVWEQAPKMAANFDRLAAAPSVTLQRAVRGTAKTLTDLSEPEHDLLTRFMQYSGLERVRANKFGHLPPEVAESASPGLNRNLQMFGLSPEELTQMQTPKMQQAVKSFREAYLPLENDRLGTLGIKEAEPSVEGAVHFPLVPISHWRDLIRIDGYKDSKVRITDPAHFMKQAIEDGAGPEEMAVLKHKLGVEHLADDVLAAKLKAVPGINTQRSVEHQLLSEGSTASLEALGTAPAYDISVYGRLRRGALRDTMQARWLDAITEGKNAKVVFTTPQQYEGDRRLVPMTVKMPGHSYVARQKIAAAKRMLGKKAADMSDSDLVAYLDSEIIREENGIRAELVRTAGSRNISKGMLGYLTRNELGVPASYDEAADLLSRRLEKLGSMKGEVTGAGETVWTFPEIKESFDKMMLRLEKYETPAAKNWATNLINKLVGINLTFNPGELGSHVFRNIDLALRTPQGRTGGERAFEIMLPKIGRMALLAKNLFTDAGTPQYQQMRNFLEDAGRLEVSFRHLQNEGIAGAVEKVVPVRGAIFEHLIPRLKVSYALSLQKLNPELSFSENPELLLRAVDGFGMHVKELQGELTYIARQYGALPFAAFESSSIPAAFRRYLKGDTGLGKQTKVAHRIENLVQDSLGSIAFASLASIMMFGKLPHEMGLRPWDVPFKDDEGHIKGINTLMFTPFQERIYKYIGMDETLKLSDKEKKEAHDIGSTIRTYINRGMSMGTRGMVNMGLGLIGTNPLVRSGSMATSGRVPWLTEDWSFLKMNKGTPEQRLARAAVDVNEISDALFTALAPGLFAVEEEKRFEGARSLVGAPTEAYEGVGAGASLGVPGLKIVNENRFSRNQKKKQQWQPPKPSPFLAPNNRFFKQ